MNTRTHTPTRDAIQPRWWLVDAEGQVLGRLASRVARILRGKHRADFSPHLDMGDYVIIVNAEKVAVTGTKLDSKLYYRHSGYPGGLRQQTLRRVLEKRPERAIWRAVRGMLPHNRLSRRALSKLKIYAGPEHPHAAQNPQPLPAEHLGAPSLTRQED
jgi:large subunit ribosomal protein L13